MFAQTKTFNPRVLISDHFDEIIYQIDINTEKFINDINIVFNEESRSKLDKINEIREIQLDKIKEIKQDHLSKWENFDQIQFEFKWTTLINDENSSNEQKLDMLKEDIILSDCILIEDKSKFSLWIMPFYINEMNARFMR